MESSAGKVESSVYIKSNSIFQLLSFTFSQWTEFDDERNDDSDDNGKSTEEEEEKPKMVNIKKEIEKHESSEDSFNHDTGFL